jgi:tRNA (guanine-N7-)-methyltransferase
VTAGRPATSSYIVRHGRLTPAQKRALETLGPRYGVGLPPPSPLDPEALFGRAGPLLVEIGSGNGAFLVARARLCPERLHLGVEVYPPGLGHTLLEIERHRLDNVRLLAEDAHTVVNAFLPPASVEHLVALFPDPWPKKRHRKRRLLLRPGFLEGAARTLVRNGWLIVVTDDLGYAEELRTALAGSTWEEGDPGNDFWKDAEATPFALRARRRGGAFARIAVRRVAP